MIIYDNTGQSYRLTNKLAEGGEGEIYQLENHPDVLCKRYRQPSGELEQKILHLSQLRALPGSDFRCTSPFACLYQDGDSTADKLHRVPHAEYTRWCLPLLVLKPTRKSMPVSGHYHAAPIYDRP